MIFFCWAGHKNNFDVDNSALSNVDELKGKTISMIYGFCTEIHFAIDSNVLVEHFLFFPRKCSFWAGQTGTFQIP